jgi:hypothetical protein
LFRQGGPTGTGATRGSGGLLGHHDGEHDQRDPGEDH